MKKSRGATLIELMLGMVIGLIIIASFMYLYTTILRTSYNILKASRLDHELRTAMALMVTDIRRAGFSASASNDMKTGLNNNPFMTPDNTVRTPSSSCILFAYDFNNDGQLPLINTTYSDERFGYRLMNTALQSRKVTDDTFQCDAGEWDSLTDNSIVKINSLQFTITSTTQPVVPSGLMTIKQVTITINAELVGDATVTRVLSEQVRVRNDLFSPTP